MVLLPYSKSHHFCAGFCCCPHQINLIRVYISCGRTFSASDVISTWTMINPSGHKRDEAALSRVCCLPLTEWEENKTIMCYNLQHLRCLRRVVFFFLVCARQQDFKTLPKDTSISCQGSILFFTFWTKLKIRLDLEHWCNKS